MAFNQIYLKDGFTLFDNQKANIKRLVTMRRALLTDRVGSGKSLSTLYSFCYLKEKGFADNMIVFTPLNAYTKRVWAKDIEKFTKLSCADFDSVKNESVDKLLKTYDVVYCKHTHLKQDYDVLRVICSRPKTLVVVDEVHAFKNPSSQLTMALRHVIENTQLFWGITGTTLSRSLEDTYNIIHLVKPWFLGNFLYFRDTYCKTVDKVIGRNPDKSLKYATEIIGIKNPDAFREKIYPVVITGESFLTVKFHYIDYTPTEQESIIYSRIANGITLDGDDDEEWLQTVLGEERVYAPEVRHIKDINAHSSRFIYLQSAADGVLTENGTQDGRGGVKMDMLMDLIRDITAKRQSVIVYFDYLCSLESAEKRLDELGLDVTFLKSTGSDVIKDGVVTEQGARERPYVIFGTRASSESVSYYFFNNVVFFHIPTVPHTFVQLVGRITRKNTLYPDDLNCYIFRSHNIDLYKMVMVSSKCAQMEVTQGEEMNVPPDYKNVINEKQTLDYVRKILLWKR